MSSTVAITQKIQRQFGIHYDTFLFAPKFIQDVLYIDSQLRLDGGPKPLSIYQLCNKVIKGEERSFLILGDSGSGKTSFALKLCHTLWGKSKLDWRVIIPIYVHLPSLVTKLNLIERNSESEFDIVKILVEELGIHEIQRCEGRIIFILDSFDEISLFSQCSKLVQNIWTITSSWSAQVSVLTCSRPEAVPKLKRQEIFEFVKFGHVGNRKYSEFTLDGLSGDAISKFLNKMEVDIIPQLRIVKDEDLTSWSAWGTLKSKIQDWESGDYNRWFLDLPDLRKLSENPYILTLICQALPGIVLKLKKEVKVLRRLCKTRVGIFHSFTEQIFEYQAERVSQRPDNLKPGAQNISYRDWLIYFRAYAHNLAGKWFNYANEGNIVKMSDEETLDSSLVEPVLNITQLEKLEKNHKGLFPPRLTHYEETKRGAICSSNRIPIENMRILRDACNGSILVYSTKENEYEFIHRSMFEYFASEQAFQSSLAEYDFILRQCLKSSSVIYEQTGFGRALIKDREILSQLVQRISIEYKKILFKLIRVSKADSKLHRISANAITILNNAHVCFSGQDYRDIQIQGADLRQSICAHTDFRGANLSNVQFGDSYLVGAQFQGACMEDVDFGEFPILKLSERFNSMISYRDRDNMMDTWVIATRGGAVRIWSTLEEKLVVTRRSMYGQEVPDFYDTRLSLLDGRVAVWDEIAKFPPTLELSTRMVTYEVSLYNLFPEWAFFNTHALQTTEGISQVCIQLCPMDKCVFVYSTCHLEVLSYTPKNASDINSLVKIGYGYPNGVLKFASIVDKNGDILVACIENTGEEERQIVVYKGNEGCTCFRIIKCFTGDPSSVRNGRFEFALIDRILFKPDGTGLAMYGPFTHLQIFENYSEMITPVHSDVELFESFAFDTTGKYIAGSTLNSDTVMIWNLPSGAFHRQFESPTLPKTSSFSNPFAFSSDSKVLALGGSEFHSEATIKIKSIDGNPFVSDSLSRISLDDVAVSNDGRIVVIGGDYCERHNKFNYIEIFNFPFQNNIGLCVPLPKDVGFDRCAIAIINSKTGAIDKRIIVIRKAHCRAVVICSKTGSILQNIQFGETLTVDRYHLCSVNTQASVCCIYSKTQGYLFWKIFENYYHKIIFQRKPELDLLNETDVNVEGMSFDCTGRYLQIVTSPLIHVPELLSKIILYDTENKTVKKINVNWSENIKSPIESLDADMSNETIFSYTYMRLLIFNACDGSLFQKVDYNFSYFSKLHFDPLSGWLFATNFEQCSLVIFQNKVCQWVLVLEIPLWFQPKKCVIYEKNNKISVLVVGNRDLCYIEFDKDDCHSWRLLWSMKNCHKLNSLNSNVDGALCLSKINTCVLKGVDSGVERRQSLKSNYLPFSDWCQEIFGTARSKFPSPFVKTAGNNFSLNEDMWVVSLAGNLSNIFKWTGHVYFIVEGIKNNRRFITRIHLTYSKKLKQVTIVVSPIVDRTPTPLNEHSWEDSKYIEFVHLAHKLSAQQYSMSRGECEQFLRNIQSDMQVRLNYNWMRKNCGVWCENHLKKVGRKVQLEVFTSALIFPRVLELLKEMRFWKKSKK